MKLNTLVIASLTTWVETIVVSFGPCRLSRIASYHKHSTTLVQKQVKLMTVFIMLDTDRVLANQLIPNAVAVNVDLATFHLTLRGSLLVR